MSFDFNKYKDDPNFCVHCGRRDIGIDNNYVIEKDVIFVYLSCKVCDGEWTECYTLSSVSYDDNFVAKTDEQLDYEYRIANMTEEEIYGS